MSVVADSILTTSVDLRRGARCVPGEFEPQAAMLLGCNELEYVHPSVMIEVVAALIHKIPLIGIVNGEEQRRQVVTQLCDWGLPASLMHFVHIPQEVMWVRDYGPQFVRRADGTVVILDAEYPHKDWGICDEAPRALASLLRVPVIKVPAIVEGGNLISNGQGLCLTTRLMVKHNELRGLSPAQVGYVLREYYGFNQAIVLEPLIAERTCHVDVFATFTAPDTVVVGRYDPKIDPVNADLLDRNAERLAGIQTSAGPLKVERIPMPSNRGGLWPTYTNVIYANRTLLMPVYYGVDPAVEREALETYRRLLPGWEIKGIDATRLIRNAGALRCVTANVPWLEHHFETPVQGARRQVA